MESDGAGAVLEAHERKLLAYVIVWALVGTSDAGVAGELMDIGRKIGLANEIDAVIGVALKNIADDLIAKVLFIDS